MSTWAEEFIKNLTGAKKNAGTDIEELFSTIVGYMLVIFITVCFIKATNYVYDQVVKAAVVLGIGCFFYLFLKEYIFPVLL